MGPQHQQPSSPGHHHHHPSNMPPERGSRQAPPRHLALPRFHPANYPTSSPAPSSSAAPSTSFSSFTSSDAAALAPSGPLSPRTSNQLRQYSEAQRQLFLHHRELVNLNRTNASANSSNLPSPGWRSSRPASPHLRPMGSPGPITPLELELEADRDDDYLLAGANVRRGRSTPQQLSEAAKEEIVEGYIQQETQSSS